MVSFQAGFGTWVVFNTNPPLLPEWIRNYHEPFLRYKMGEISLGKTFESLVFEINWSSRTYRDQSGIWNFVLPLEGHPSRSDEGAWRTERTWEIYAQHVAGDHVVTLNELLSVFEMEHLCCPTNAEKVRPNSHKRRILCKLLSFSRKLQMYRDKLGTGLARWHNLQRTLRMVPFQSETLLDKMRTYQVEWWTLRVMLRTVSGQFGHGSGEVAHGPGLVAHGSGQIAQGSGSVAHASYISCARYRPGWTRDGSQCSRLGTNCARFSTSLNKLRTVLDKMHAVPPKLAKAPNNQHVLRNTCSHLRVAVAWKANNRRRLF